MEQRTHRHTWACFQSCYSGQRSRASSQTYVPLMFLNRQHFCSVQSTAKLLPLSWVTEHLLSLILDYLQLATMKQVSSVFDFLELSNLILTCFGCGQFGLLVDPSRLTQHTAWASIRLPTPESQYCAVSNLWTLDPYRRGRCAPQRHTGQVVTHSLVCIYSLPSVPTQ